MNLFSIPPELPFLDTLAGGLDNPEALVLLPTRRAAAALRQAFLRRIPEGEARLLPRMRALAGLSTEDAEELALPSLLEQAPAVAPLRRQAVLASLVLRLPPRNGGPGSAAQAWALAGELATLLDETALEEGDLPLLRSLSPTALQEHWLARLDGLVPAELAQHWQITLLFLRGVLQEWQGWLNREGLLDVGLARVLALAAQEKAWVEHPPAYPVIAAGIGPGGTIPAAAALLRQIARMPQGQVVLPGFPEPMTDDLATLIEGAPTHPLFGQCRLLRAIGATYKDLKPWPQPAPDALVPAIPGEISAGPRAPLLAMALRPAEALASWQQHDPLRWAPGLVGLQRLTAAEPQQEAAAIALLLRETLNRPGARAALVTPDRELARRVSAELLRHGVLADDSAGTPLGETPAGAFLRLLAEAVAEDLAPLPLLALLKHPLAAGGMERGQWLAATRRLELLALRGVRPAPGLQGLRLAVEAALADSRRRRSAEQAEPSALAPQAASLSIPEAVGPEAVGAETEAAQEPALALLDALGAALGDFTHLPTSPSLPATDLLARHMAAAEALAATPEEPGGLRLYEGAEGETLALLLADLAEACAALPPLSPADWPALFEATLEGTSVHSPRAARGRPDLPHPRIEILGLLEARLQSFDRVILGALDENIWPQATHPGPWMSRPMRAQYGLPAPEARIGRVAADFLAAACAAPEAILSRALRRGGTPTVPARWLTRLDTFLRGQDLAMASSPATGWAAALDQPSAVRPWPRPSPAPPAALRPRRLSVTEVATLRADPYAFYARRMLRLSPLNPLDAEPGASEYGTLVHDALARFLAGLGEVNLEATGAPDTSSHNADASWPGMERARQLWEEAAATVLAEAAPRPGIAAFWVTRLARIGEFVLGQEALLRQAGLLSRCLVEISGRLTLRYEEGEVELTGRADRLDLLADGSVAIIDYKTGQPPTQSALADGRSPQLPLEAAMVARGAFPGLNAGTPTSALAYWRLTGGPQAGEVKQVGKDAASTADLAEAALEGLERLARHWLLGEAGFTSRPHPGLTTAGGDYDHLARRAEWSATEA